MQSYIFLWKSSKFRNNNPNSQLLESKQPGGEEEEERTKGNKVKSENFLYIITFTERFFPVSAH